MAAAQNPFAGSPTVREFIRGLQVQAVNRFKGINAYSTFPTLGANEAQDLLNVIISGSGGLSKLRLPVKLTSGGVGNFGFASFWDFQQANGTRQVIAQLGNAFYAITNNFGTTTQIDNNPLNLGQWSMATANNILFGVNGNRAIKWLGSPFNTAFQEWGIVAPTNAPTVANSAGGLSPATGYSYEYAWDYSPTGHVGNAGPASASTGPLANKQFQVTSSAIPLDPDNFIISGIDSVVFFRTLDGGGDYFRLCTVNNATGAVITYAVGAIVTVNFSGSGGVQINDNTPDISLDLQTHAPLINNVPIIGKYVAVGQGRVFIANLVGSPQDIEYSGYEQVLIGRPEESFPPNNRLRLSIGADSVSGIGVLQAGLVAFSQTGKMFMLRGQVEDITLLVPVVFTQYLEELPWVLGCASHFTIQPTPFGLIWLAGDKTVQLFDGANEPIDIAPGIYPILRRITPGTEAQCVAGYFNWLERDWYGLLVCLDGALTFTHIIFLAANVAPGSNTIESVEAFISDLPSRIPGTAWIGTLTTAKLQRILCLGAQGYIQQIPVTSDTVNGITTDYTINPATNGDLNAYWRSGYFGNDTPYASRMWRWIRLVSDQDSANFQAQLRYVDNYRRTFVAPELLGPYEFTQPRLGLNRRANLLSVEIDFPAIDAPCNVLELQVAQIQTSQR